MNKDFDLEDFLDNILSLDYDEEFDDEEYKRRDTPRVGQEDDQDDVE